MSYPIEKLSYYADYLYKNAFLKTAELLSAVIVKAFQLNYSAHCRIGASGPVKISADSTFEISYLVYTGPTVNISRWQRFGDENQTVNVYATADASYPTGITVSNKTIDALSVPVNMGGGKVGIPVAAHQMPVGQTVTISGTENYDGNYIVDNLTTTNQVVIAYPNFVIETFNGSEKIFTGHVYVSTSEGVPKEFTYVAAGDVNESFTVFSAISDQNQKQVFIVDVDGNILNTVTITSDIYLINSLSSYYCSIENLPSFQGFTVTFGDGVTSKKLSAGEYVLVKYADTQGASGGVQGVDVITKAFPTLQNSQGNTAAVYITNDTQISGGKDYEDITSIKHKARSLFGAGYRAHSEFDWVAVLLSNPFVSKAKVWTQYDLGETDIGISNSIVHISAVSSSGQVLSPSQQSTILFDTIKPKRSITDIVKFEQLQSVCARFVIAARINPVPSNTVRDLIFNSLSGKYGILNTDYKVNIYDSDAIRMISDASDDIIYHQTSVFHVERSESYPEINATVGSRTIVVSFTSTQDVNPANQVYLLTDSVELWIRRKIAGVLQDPKQIGITSPYDSEILEGYNGYTIVGGVINYVANQISYNVLDIIDDDPPDGGTTFGVLNPESSDDDGYFLRIVYKTRDGNGNFTNDIRLPYFYNITDIQQEDIDFFFTPSYA